MGDYQMFLNEDEAVVLQRCYHCVSVYNTRSKAVGYEVSLTRSIQPHKQCLGYDPALLQHCHHMGYSKPQRSAMTCMTMVLDRNIGMAPGFPVCASVHSDTDGNDRGRY